MDQELKSELTKQQIEDNAFDLFYENGFKSTSVNDVMKRAKMSKGAFYHHYKNKKELGLKIIEKKIQERVFKGMIEPLKKQGNPIEILEDTFFKRINSFPDFEKKLGCPMNNFINEIGNYENCYQNALRNIIEQWKQEIVYLIERGKKDKYIKSEISSHNTAIYLISAFEGIRGIRKLYNTDEVLDSYLLALKEYLFQLKK